MDILSADIQHDMKHADGKPHAHHVETAHHVENSSASDSIGALEKGPSHSAGYDLKGIPVENGEYVVTAKTWAVVMVSKTIQQLRKRCLLTYKGPCVVVWNFVLASAIHQHHPRADCGGDGHARRRHLVHISVHHGRYHCLHDLWSKQVCIAISVRRKQ
jgi:hypothetical protein